MYVYTYTQIYIYIYIYIYMYIFIFVYGTLILRHRHRNDPCVLFIAMLLSATPGWHLAHDLPIYPFAYLPTCLPTYVRKYALGMPTYLPAYLPTLCTYLFTCLLVYVLTYVCNQGKKNLLPFSRLKILITRKKILNSTYFKNIIIFFINTKRCIFFKLKDSSHSV